MFPLRGLDLKPYLSRDRPFMQSNTESKNSCKNDNKNNPENNTGNCIGKDNSVDENNDNDLSNRKVDQENKSNLETEVDDQRNRDNKKKSDNNNEEGMKNMSVSSPTSSPNPKSNLNSSSNSPDHNGENKENPEREFDANLFPPIYDLLGVSNHCGTLNGGHYIAHVDTNAGAKIYRKHRTENGNDDGSRRNGYSNSSPNPNSNNTEASEDGVQEDKDGARWMCFNDEHVSSANTANIVGPTAYVLFYRLREF
jgi:hypothetical protein